MKINPLPILRIVILLIINLSALACIWTGPAIPALQAIDILFFSVFIITSIMLTDD